MRRGKEAAHIVYGVPLTINAAHFMYFEVIDKLLEFCDDHDVSHIPLDQFLQV